MGLDINIETNNHEEVFTPEFYLNEKEYWYPMNLSRDFCNVMCARTWAEAPEIEQVESITGIELTSIYDMNDYMDEEEEAEYLSAIRQSESEQEYQKRIARIKADRDRLKGNIGKVLETVNLLIEKLSRMEHYEKQIVPGAWDAESINFYFSNFKSDPGDGYIGNNFGQDLRNFKRFLEYALSKGTETVYFRYG